MQNFWSFDVGAEYPSECIILNLLKSIKELGIGVFKCEGGAVLEFGMNKGIVYDVLSIGSPFCTLDLNELEEGGGRLDLVLNMSGEVDSSGRHGKAEIVIGGYDWDGIITKEEIPDGRGVDIHDATLGDIVNHSILSGPSLGDVQHDPGLWYGTCQEKTVVSEE